MRLAPGPRVWALGQPVDGDRPVLGRDVRGRLRGQRGPVRAGVVLPGRQALRALRTSAAREASCDRHAATVVDASGAATPARGIPYGGCGYSPRMSEDHVLDTLRRLAQNLKPGDLDHTLSQITNAAVEVLPGVHYASISVKHADGRLETAAPTDDMLLGIDAAQYELQEGPCYDAASDKTYVTSPHLAADERYPKYAA